MNKLPYGIASPRQDLDLDIESGNPRKIRRRKHSVFFVMIRALRSRISRLPKLHPAAIFLVSLSLVLTLIFMISASETRLTAASSVAGTVAISYPFPNLRSLVMVAGHSVYTSSSCGKVDSEDSWFLQSYQKQRGQASSFVEHIREGVEIAARDSDSLLLFSGGETRKDAGPRSEAQSYWGVAESQGWFGKKNGVRNRALTEEHARDSFENLLFSVCRFRELTGSYPENITVVSYDFKKERFTQLHRSAIRFPENRFFYSGTSAKLASREEALKGEAAVRAQFQKDPYGCSSSLYWKKLGRDPFHRTIPYPTGCPELKGLFSYCSSDPYPGALPWKS